MAHDDAWLTATVRAAAAGDQRAWEALTRRYEPMLRRVGRGYRLQPADVEDSLQACWMRLFTHIRTLRDPTAIGSWLCTAMRRQSLRAYQRTTREVLSDTPLDPVWPAPDCVESAVVEAERNAVVRQAVGRLEGRQRELFEMLIASHRTSYVEISAGLQMPVGSIGPTRERGLASLRQDPDLALVARIG